MKNHIDFKIFKKLDLGRGVKPWSIVNEYRSYAAVYLEPDDKGNRIPIFYQAVFSIEILREQCWGYIINVDNIIMRELIDELKNRLEKLGSDKQLEKFVRLYRLNYPGRLNVGVKPTNEDFWNLYYEQTNQNATIGEGFKAYETEDFKKWKIKKDAEN